METGILKTVAQIASIGGLAIGVLLILFRDIIRKNIFPSLSKDQAYRLIRLIIILVWGVAFVGIGAWVYTSTVNQVLNPPNRVYDLPPVILRDQVADLLQENPLNFKLISISEGNIETDYKEYPGEGEFHGILWWKKQWQERGKYYLEIRPVWNETAKSQLFIKGQTENRPNDNYPWEECKCVKTDTRISDILQVIDSKIRR